MRNIWILFKREMMVYFFSPIAYIVAGCVLLVMGISFFLTLQFLENSWGDYSPMEMFFNGFFTWIILLAVPPIITMRLFAEEKKSGAIETLMTTPLRDIEYVLAKFFSGYVFYMLLWIPTLNIIFVLRYFAKDHTPLDLGPVMGVYSGIFLIGMLFTAVGCVASASTRNQIVAAVIAFTLNCGLFLVGFLFYGSVAGPYHDFFESIAMLTHLQDMTKGWIKWEQVGFYLSSTIFLLFVTHRMVQARQWKG